MNLTDIKDINSECHKYILLVRKKKQEYFRLKIEEKDKNLILYKTSQNLFKNIFLSKINNNNIDNDILNK